MNKVINIIGETYRQKYNFSETKIQKIQYTLKAIWNEVSKVLIYSFIFLLLETFKEFLLVYVCLVSTRIFGGGLHCKNYLSCFTWSLIFIFTCVYVPKLISFQNILYIIACFSLTPVLFFAPSLPKKRRIRSYKQYWILKTLAIVNLLFWVLIASYFETNTSSNSILLTVILSNYQLIISHYKNKKMKEVI